MFSDSDDEDPTGLDGADFANVEFGSGSDEQEPASPPAPPLRQTPLQVQQAQRQHALRAAQERYEDDRRQRQQRDQPTQNARAAAVKSTAPGEGGGEGGMHFDEQYELPFERDFGRFREQLTEDRCERLEREGYVVIDGFLGSGWSSAVRQEIRWLQNHGLMSPNVTQFIGTDGKPLRASKPNIFEVDLFSEFHRNKLPELNEIFWHSDEMVLAIEHHLGVRRLKLRKGFGEHAIKLQHNAGGGGCFPIHFDNPGEPNCRRLTCLLYLNPDWSDGDGGELELVPFLKEPVRVRPVMDRLVIFFSETVLHRVLPASVPRYVITIWIDGNGDLPLPLSAGTAPERPTADDVGALWGDADNVEQLADFLRVSPLQRVLARSVYEEEFKSSLVDCMEGVPGFEEMLQGHEQSIATMNADAMTLSVVQKLRALKPSSSGTVV
jgi:hypothetical protein